MMNFANFAKRLMKTRLMNPTRLMTTNILVFEGKNNDPLKPIKPLEPAKVALDSQGATNELYYQQDTFEDKLLPAGTELVSLTHAAGCSSGYFMPKKDFDTMKKPDGTSVGLDSTILCRAAQIAPYIDETAGTATYKSKLVVYKLQSDLYCASAQGNITANPHLGTGDAQQIMIPKAQDLITMSLDHIEDPSKPNDPNKPVLKQLELQKILSMMFVFSRSVKRHNLYNPYNSNKNEPPSLSGRATDC